MTFDGMFHDFICHRAKSRWKKKSCCISAAKTNLKTKLKLNLIAAHLIQTLLKQF